MSRTRHYHHGQQHQHHHQRQHHPHDLHHNDDEHHNHNQHQNHDDFHCQHHHHQRCFLRNHPNHLIKESFDFFDWNNNGKISYSSLQVILLKLYQSPSSARHIHPKSESPGSPDSANYLNFQQNYSLSTQNFWDFLNDLRTFVAKF